MSKKNVFDESKFKLRSRTILGKPTVPSTVKFLVTQGVVKNELQALGLLTTVLIMLFSISIYLLDSTNIPIATLDQTLSAATR